MSLTKPQALEMFRSDDLIGIGMEANALRRRLHPEGVATYIIDRNINYTNFCTEYSTFSPFYAPVKGPAPAKAYLPICRIVGCHVPDQTPSSRDVPLRRSDRDRHGGQCAPPPAAS